MVRSVVRMEENQALDAAYAMVEKGPAGVLLVLKDRECGIFDCTAINSDQFP